MATGETRPGAGRPQGRANKINDEARRAALAGGPSPLDFLLSIMRDEAEPIERRIDAGKASAPYLHAQLQAVSVSGPDGAPIQTQSTVLDAKSLTWDERQKMREILEAAQARTTATRG